MKNQGSSPGVRAGHAAVNIGTKASSYRLKVIYKCDVCYIVHPTRGLLFGLIP